jgi:hypothetical protein
MQVARTSAAYLVASVALVAAYHTFASAQTVEEYQWALDNANNNMGCDSIPYADTRRRCIDASYDVGELCKEGTRSCDKVGNSKNEPNRDYADGYKRELQTRYEWNQGCYKAREIVRSYFKDAVITANGATGEQQPLARELQGIWTTSIAKHQQASDEAQKAVDNCKRRLDAQDY